MVLDSYDQLICLPLVEGFAVIILFDRKVRCMVLTDHESRFCKVHLYAPYAMLYYIKIIRQCVCFAENSLTGEMTQ